VGMGTHSVAGTDGTLEMEVGKAGGDFTGVTRRSDPMRQRGVDMKIMTSDIF
jgi:hypothetical protein